MSDAPIPVDGSPGAAPDPAHEVEVDLAAFLPDGVELSVDDAVDGVPVAGDLAPDVVDASGPPAVDTEALAQIERDLDAVDAAIAALDAGTYGIDPATGQPIDDALLATDPTRLS